MEMEEFQKLDKDNKTNMKRFLITFFSIVVVVLVISGFVAPINALAQGDGVTCKADTDCTNGRVCSGGLCVQSSANKNTTKCKADSDCSGGGTCNTTTGTCSGGADPSKNTTPSGTSSTTTVIKNPLKIKNAGDLIKTLINFALTLVGVIAAAMIIYGGIIYMTSAGNDQRVQQGKTILTYAIVGLIISIAAGVIVQLVFKAVGVA